MEWPRRSRPLPRGTLFRDAGIRVFDVAGLQRRRPQDHLGLWIAELLRVVRLHALELHGQHARLFPFAIRSELDIANDGAVTQFTEKPPGEGRWINGGYFVLSPKVGDYIHDDMTPWEREPMETLAREGQVAAYKHDGFWQPMDTLHDKNLLEGLWNSNRAPWKVW